MEFNEHAVMLGKESPRVYISALEEYARQSPHPPFHTGSNKYMPCESRVTGCVHTRHAKYQPSELPVVHAVFEILTNHRYTTRPVSKGTHILYIHANALSSSHLFILSQHFPFTHYSNIIHSFITPTTITTTTTTTTPPQCSTTPSSLSWLAPPPFLLASPTSSSEAA